MISFIEIIISYAPLRLQVSLAVQLIIVGTVRFHRPVHCSFYRCALAALTKDHRLTIFTKQAKKWVAVAEPSQLFYEYLQSRKYEMPWMTNTSSLVYQTAALQDLQMKSYATAAISKYNGSNNCYCFLHRHDQP